MTAVERYQLSGRDLDLIERKARIVAGGGLVPAVAGNADAAAYVMLRGAAFGIDPLDAFEHIHVFDTKHGKRATVSAQLMGGIARRGGCILEWGRCDDTVAEETLTRPDGRSTTLTYTIAQAEKAGLTGKDNWKNHPAAMLRAAVQRNLVRMAAPDVLLGMPLSQDVDWHAEFDGEVDDLDTPDNGPAAVTAAPPAAMVPPPPPTAPLAEATRIELADRLRRLPVDMRDAVRQVWKTRRLPALLAEHATTADGVRMAELVADGEAFADQIRPGWRDAPPGEVHDTAPESRGYGDDDDYGRPFGDDE